MIFFSLLQKWMKSEIIIITIIITVDCLAIVVFGNSQKKKKQYLDS